jgi:NAD(P)-dependent dehydrogenase (short-subunit alcohol dehydrogenase family)
MLDAAIANVARVTGKSRDAARSLLLKQSGGRFVTEAEVVSVILQLCDESATTGQAIVIDGGEGS